MNDNQQDNSTQKLSKNSDLEQALNTATQYHQAGNLQQAEYGYRHILQVQPNHPLALHLLGVIGYQVGQYEMAEQLITQAIEIKPDFDEAHNNLGNVMKSLGRLKEALFHYQQAINLNPASAEVHYNLAIVHEALGEEEQAEICYLKAIEIKDDGAEVHFNLGNLYRRTGLRDKAIKHYQKSIEIKPQYAEAYRQITSLNKYNVVDSELKTMEKLFSSMDSNEHQKMHLAFGLGKAFEDLHQFKKSFEFIQQGNFLRRKNFKFQIDDWDEYISKQMMFFNKDLFEQYTSSGYADETPIFILGMPRSGTSLVEQILASHPSIYGAGEIQTLNATIADVFDMKYFPENLLQQTTATFKQLGEKYIQATQSGNKQTQFITDKMPDNFKIIGMIKLLLPNAKIIHCCREPMDNCLSILKTYFSSKDLVYAYDQVELARYYNGYRDLMNHWHTTLPGFIYDIHYEDIVSDQEKQTRMLLEHCGLEWDDACLNFYKTKRAVKTASASQVRKPIYSDSVELWKQYEKQLAPLIKTLDNG